MYKILAINPGSTSTKIAVYEGEKLLFQESIDYSLEKIQDFKSINDQYEMRYESIVDLVGSKNFDLGQLDAIVGRGGPVAPLKSGAYRMTKELYEKMLNKPMSRHVSLLGGIIAYRMGEDLKIPSFIYDGVSTDELEDIARITGLKGIYRKSLCHALNMRASAIKYGEEIGRNYEDLNLIVAHIGGGISLSAHHKARMIDIVSDDEGAFSAERAGRIPGRTLLKLAYSEGEDYESVYKKLRGGGGLISHFGTNDARKVEDLISQGDQEARLVYEAMAYNLAKSIGELAPVLYGRIDGIIITGGLAYSELFTSLLVKRIEFLGPIKIMPGENELESLAYGGLRVLRGQEEANIFRE